MITSRTITQNKVKSLDVSLPTEEAKTPEMVTVVKSQPVAECVNEVKNNDEFKSSPLSARAQRVKESLRRKCVVKAVLLKADGESQEIDYNASSKQANRLVNGRPTIIGELEDIQVIIVRCLNEGNSPLNQHILPVPFCNKQYHGPYLLYRVDWQGNPIHLSLKQYQQYVDDNKTLTENARKHFDPIDNQEIKAKSSFNSNSRLTLIYLRSEVDKEIRARFKTENGRNPTDSEIQDSVNESLQRLVNDLAQYSSKMNDADYDPQSDASVASDSIIHNLEHLKSIYLEENGNDINDADLYGTLLSSHYVLNNETEDDRDWRLQLKDALNYVRERGRFDGRILAEKISETFYELNGAEPTLDELIDVFRRIKSELAAEAEQDLKDDERENERDPSDIVDISFRVVGQDLVHRAKSSFIICRGREPTESELSGAVHKLALKLADDAIDKFAATDYDANYDPNNVNDVTLARDDKVEDAVWDEDNFNLKMLASDLIKSRTGAAAAYSVYFAKTSAKQESKNLVNAIASFKMRNKRDPTSIEMHRLKKFLKIEKETSVIEFKLSQREQKYERQQTEPRERKESVLMHSKVLVTPVKKKKFAARYNVYFEDDEVDQEKNERMAIKWFKRFNNRQPTKLESAGIKQFIKSEKTQLTELEYDVPIADDCKQTELDDAILKKLKTDCVVKKKLSTKYTLNFDDKQERQNGDEKQANKWFKRFNNRDPTQFEQENIKQFIKADKTDTIDID